MEPKDFLEKLERLNLSQPALCEKLNAEWGTSYRLQDANKWAYGRRAVPLAVKIYLTLSLEIQRLRSKRKRRPKAA